MVGLAEPLSELQTSIWVTKIELNYFHCLLIAHTTLLYLFEFTFRLDSLQLVQAPGGNDDFFSSQSHHGLG